MPEGNMLFSAQLSDCVRASEPRNEMNGVLGHDSAQGLTGPWTY